jgi:predicted transcriptional regulator
MSQIVVTARIDVETATKLDRLGEAFDRSRSWMLAQALKRYVEEGNAFLEDLLEADAQIARGEYVTQEEIEQEFLGTSTAHKSAA